MENKEFVIVVDFGGQYNQLIARRVRENHVYCEVYPYNKALDKIKELKPQGIIFTGGPNSVYEVKLSEKLKKRFLNLVFLFLACAMVCNLWRIHWVAKLNLRITVNLVKHLLKWTLHLHCSKALEEDQVVLECLMLTM